jgi:hypothetical protein
MRTFVGFVVERYPFVDYRSRSAIAAVADQPRGSAMSAQRRVVRASVGVFMAFTCALGLGGFAATASATPAAHHPPHQHCPRGHRGHYPPGKCRVFFNRGVYHPGQKVKFETGKVFKAHEKVTEQLFCHQGRYSKKYGSKKAGGFGRAKDTITLSKHLGNWGCTLSLKGTKSHIVLNGHLKVRK